jgi:hypothetical protein
MTTTKEIVSLRGTLRGEGHQRTCSVRATRSSMYEDESTVPVAIAYSRCDIVDGDDFPEGDYELEFDGHKVLLRKKGGHYLARG